MRQPCNGEPPTPRTKELGRPVRVAAAPARHDMRASRGLFRWLVLVVGLLGALGRVAAENVTGTLGTAPPAPGSVRASAPAPAGGPGDGHNAGNSDGDDSSVPPDAPPSDDAAAAATASAVSVSSPTGSGLSPAPGSVSQHRGADARVQQQQQHGRGARFTSKDEAGG
jgi:hypothetical protein